MKKVKKNQSPTLSNKKRKLSKSDWITMGIIGIASVFGAIWQATGNDVCGGIFIIGEITAFGYLTVITYKKCKTEIKKK